MGDFYLKRGYDIPLAGAPAPEIVNAPMPKIVAITPIDFVGIKPRPAVEEGQTVKVGSPLVYSKDDEEYFFTSPVSGTVKEVRRGPRRIITHVVIEPDGLNEALEFKRYDAAQIVGLSSETVLSQVKRSGLLGCFRERPFNNTANPAHPPRDIFISSFDSAPLAPDYALLVKDNETAFQAGLDVCSRMTKGKVHLGVQAGSATPAAFAQARNVAVHRFSGPHPAGNVGVQIHHVAPIKGRNDHVWTTDVPTVIRLGKLFLSGKVDGTQIVAVTGSASKVQKYVRTVYGAPIETLIGADGFSPAVRVISGNALTGKVVQAGDFLHAFDHMVTVLPEAVSPEFIGWMLPGANKSSLFRVFLGKLMAGKKFTQHTGRNGGHRALIFTGIYEQVTPIDIFPVYLIKSIMANDIEEMEGLGIYEVVEEDVALCEYVCPSKTEFQKILREGLTVIEKDV